MGAPPVVFGALAEHSLMRRPVPVGEAPTGAAEAAALPLITPQVCVEKHRGWTEVLD